MSTPTPDLPAQTGNLPAEPAPADDDLQDTYPPDPPTVDGVLLTRNVYQGP